MMNILVVLMLTIPLIFRVVMPVSGNFRENVR